VDRKPIIILLAGLFAILTGCSDQGSAPSDQVGEVALDGEVTQQFELLNTGGAPTTTFKASDTVVFVYRLTNHTNKDLMILMGNGGPVVRFLVQRDSVVINDSFEGHAFTANAPRYPFLRNQTIEERWAVGTARLPQGGYSAVAEPRGSLQDSGVPPKTAVSFDVQ
jgi:hypothetical protein